VALPAEHVRGLTNSEVIVLCLAKPEDAEAFAKRFGGERLKTASPR